MSYQQAILESAWLGKLDAYAGAFSSNADLSGEEVQLSAHVDIELLSGVLIGGFDCKVDLTHDSDDWDITGIEYRSEFGGPSASFDVGYLRKREPNGTLKDLIEREILHLVDVQYNALADEATVTAREALEQ